MNIYVLYENDMFDKNGDCSIDKEFVVSKDSYTGAEFAEICRKAKKDCKSKYNEVSPFHVVDILTELYNFHKIEVCAGYEL